MKAVLSSPLETYTSLQCPPQNPISKVLVKVCLLVRDQPACIGRDCFLHGGVGVGVVGAGVVVLGVEVVIGVKVVSRLCRGLWPAS